MFWLAWYDVVIVPSRNNIFWFSEIKYLRLHFNYNISSVLLSFTAWLVINFKMCRKRLFICLGALEKVKWKYRIDAVLCHMAINIFLHLIQFQWADGEMKLKGNENERSLNRLLNWRRCAIASYRIDEGREYYVFRESIKALRAHVNNIIYSIIVGKYKWNPSCVRCGERIAPKTFV